MSFRFFSVLFISPLDTSSCDSFSLCVGEGSTLCDQRQLLLHDTRLLSGTVSSRHHILHDFFVLGRALRPQSLLRYVRLRTSPSVAREGVRHKIPSALGSWCLGLYRRIRLILLSFFKMRTLPLVHVKFIYTFLRCCLAMVQ